MIAYALKSAFVLALLYSSFVVLLGRETLHRFNRLMLLLTMAISLVLPVVHITTDEPTAIYSILTPALSQHGLGEANTAQATTQEASGGVDSGLPQTAESMPYAIQLRARDMVMAVYLTGVAVMIAILLVRLALLARILRGGMRHSDKRGNTVILRGDDTPPFSIFRYIVMSVDDYERHRNTILAHEQEHIRLGHTYDLLLLEATKAIQWFNPFVYLLSRDLQAVHEYEADEAVINLGIDAKTYQQLLVMKVVGNRLQPFAHNFNHSSLKNRIIMMNRTKSHSSRALKAALTIPVIAFALYTFATPRTGQAIAPTTPALQTEQKIYAEGEVDSKATFRGGEMEKYKYLIDNMRYPKEAQEQKAQGRVTVQFVIETDGRITNARVTKSVNPALDAEALRVFNAMPKWTPATIKGQAVRQRVTDAIIFRL